MTTSAPQADAFAPMPSPPYYAVIFASQRGDEGEPAYQRTAARMLALAAAQPGCLGVESTRGSDGFGITVSYWDSLEAIAAWRAEAEHTAAREQGRGQWYTRYQLRIARVERAYAFSRDAS